MNHISENLEDHIDAPIKKAVAGLALLGLNPMMSCCGFSYENEVVPKTHLKKAYVYLGQKKENCCPLYAHKLLCLGSLSKWTIGTVRDGDELTVFDFYGETWTENHPWKNEDAVHNYEVFLLAINSLNKAIEQMETFMLDSVNLEDGNTFYVNLTSFWKYKPTKPWLITKEIWKNLPN